MLKLVLPALEKRTAPGGPVKVPEEVGSGA